MSLLQTSESRLTAWIESQNFQGWDPYDALNSPLLWRLTFGQRRLGQVWVQLLKRSPVNFRPFLGVPKGYNPKGMGLFLATYWRKYQRSGNDNHLAKVKFFADWLRANQSPGYAGACWGYNFPWPNRGFFAPAGVPTIVNTAFIGLALMEIGDWRLEMTTPEIANLQSLALETAVSACHFITQDLNQLQFAADKLCFSYTPTDQRFVHNANVLGAWLLAGVGAKTENGRFQQLAHAAAQYTLHHQRPDGSWLYGEDPIDHWIDNFHTGFVLVALRQIGRSLKTAEWDNTIRKGYDYWKNNFFLADGTPKYYAHKTYPIDVHSVAQAILTFRAFTDWDAEAENLAQKTAEWGIRHLQDTAGFFHFQIHPCYRIRIPYMRWSQAWMQRALNELI